jgi:hemoglobin
MSASARPDDEQVERHHAHALRTRAEKRAHAEGLGVDAEFVSSFVDAFYARIRADELLGPIFAKKIHDWDDHLGRMKGFWRSVLFSSGEYSGNPMVKHVAIPGLDKAHFAHWLELFYATLRDLGGNDEAVELVGSRARMIADSLLTGIAMKREGLAGSRAGQDLPTP